MIAALWAIPAIVIILLLFPKLAFGIEMPTQQEALTTDPITTAYEALVQTKNLVYKLHALDLWFVAVLAETVHVTIPPFIFMLVGFSLIFVGIFAGLRLVKVMTKHAVIISGVVVGAILLLGLVVGP